MLIQRHIDSSQKVEAERLKLKTQRADFENKVKELTDINIELAQRIVRAEVTIPALCEHARRLTTSDQDKLFHAALDLLADVLQVKAASLWLFSAKESQPIRSQFRGTGDPRLRAEVLSKWTETADVVLLADLGLSMDPRMPFMIGRLRDGQDGDVIAYLTIDEIPFRQTAQVRRLFGSVVGWISLAIGLSRKASAKAALS